MGQKVNPTSLRVGINKYWQSTWFEKKSYSTFLKEDYKIRNYIEKNYSTEDTYCFNEPKLHKGIFNGIMTGNCTEILEYTASDEIAVCNLASINLTSFVDRENSKKYNLFCLFKL